MEGKGEDRLSSLPDAILLVILSLVPIRTAAATSVLSRRWRHLWTGLSRIEFCSKSKGPDSIAILVHIIQQLTSPKLHSFSLEHDSFNLFEADIVELHDSSNLFDADIVELHDSSNLFDADIVESCLREVCRRNVETIYFDNTGNFVPACVFNSQYLVSLHLCGRLNFASAEIGVIQLPSLKVLRLSHICDIGPWMDSLWSSPLLEYLELRLDLPHDEHYVLNIFALNLKFLELDIFYCSPSLTHNTKIFIHAPQLAKLEISDYCSSTCYFVKNPAKLVDATVNCVVDPNSLSFFYPAVVESWNLMGEEERVHQLTQFFRGLSSVANLQLVMDTGANNIFTCHTSVDQGILPDFLNLSRLEITLYYGTGPHCWKDFLLSLHCFPNLKELKMIIMELVDDPMDWCAPDIVPDCLATKLKTITITVHEMNDANFKCLKYILSNGSVLEKLCIEWSNDTFMEDKEKDMRLNVELKLCKSLFNLPRSSSTCEVVFSGWCLEEASSKTFNGISFLCRIYD